MNTTIQSNVHRNWYVIDANKKILGRLSSIVSKILQGKHKVEYSPNIDAGDYIIIINADKIVVTGNKFKNKKYYSHSQYPGGLKSVYFFQLYKKNPIRILEISIRGMLPKNSLGKKMYKKLKIYTGIIHPHNAQKPKNIDIFTI